MDFVEKKRQLEAMRDKLQEQHAAQMNWIAGQIALCNEALEPTPLSPPVDPTTIVSPAANGLDIALGD